MAKAKVIHHPDVIEYHSRIPKYKREIIVLERNIERLYNIIDILKAEINK